jgi:hypothetical protein
MPEQLGLRLLREQIKVAWACITPFESMPDPEMWSYLLNLNAVGNLLNLSNLKLISVILSIPTYGTKGYLCHHPPP